jgi:hypothetical protein
LINDCSELKKENLKMKNRRWIAMSLLGLVDGVPQNNNFNNAIAWVAWDQIPRHVIERIEMKSSATGIRAS